MGDEFIHNEEKSWFHTIPAQMTILKDFSLFTKMKLFSILKLVLVSLKPRINGDSVKMQTGIIVCKWTVYFTGFYDKYKLHPSVVVVTYLHLRQKWMSKPRTTETVGDSFIHSTKIYRALSLFLALAICWEKTTVSVTLSLLLLGFRTQVLQRQPCRVRPLSETQVLWSSILTIKKNCFIADVTRMGASTSVQVQKRCCRLHVVLPDTIFNPVKLPVV